MYFDLVPLICFTCSVDFCVTDCTKVCISARRESVNSNFPQDIDLNCKIHRVRQNLHRFSHSRAFSATSTTADIGP